MKAQGSNKEMAKALQVLAKGLASKVQTMQKFLSKEEMELLKKDVDIKKLNDKIRELGVEMKDLDKHLNSL